MSLKSEVILRFSIGLIFFSALLFIPAGSPRFWQAWAVLLAGFVPSVLGFVHFYKHDPQLIERRMQSKEKMSDQRTLMRTYKFVALAAVVVPGLDYRFGWTRTYLRSVPLWLNLLSFVLIFASICLAFWVFAVNSFASRTIQVEPGQRVISTGPYRVVRHPLYLGSLLMWFALPTALGSFVALPVFLVLIPLYVLRLLREEKFLRRELPGYDEYCTHTRYHLVPLVW